MRYAFGRGGGEPLPEIRFLSSRGVIALPARAAGGRLTICGESLDSQMVSCYIPNELPEVPQ